MITAREIAIAALDPNVFFEPTSLGKISEIKFTSLYCVDICSKRTT